MKIIEAEGIAVIPEVKPTPNTFGDKV